MTNPQPLPPRDTQCLREAKALMDSVIKTLPPDRSSDYGDQVNSVVAMAANIGTDRYRACMARPATTAPRR